MSHDLALRYIVQTLTTLPAMPTPAVFDYAALTDAGRVRGHNEDALAVSPGIGLVVLADGMGGYAAGEVASDIAVTVIKDVVEQHFLSKPVVVDELWQVLADAVLEAHTAIIAATPRDAIPWSR